MTGVSLIALGFALAAQDTRPPQTHEDPITRGGPQRLGTVKPLPGSAPPSPAPPPAVPRPPSPPSVVPRPPAPPPPAPPPPPPSVARAQQPVPRGLPLSSIRESDYPPAMLRAHATGRTEFRLSIDATGRITRCEVTGSSGWPALDAATCTLMQQRASFAPARNATGVAIPGQWSDDYRWVLPDIPAQFTSWARVTRFVVVDGGRVRECRATRYGPAPLAAKDLCTLVSRETLAALRGPGSNPVTLTFAEVNQVDGVAMPSIYAPPSGNVLFRRTLALAVDRQGAIQSCRVSAQIGAREVVPLTNSYDCHPGLVFIPTSAPWGSAPRRQADYTVSVTLGDAAQTRPDVSPPSVPAQPMMAPPAPPPPPLPPRYPPAPPPPPAPSQYSERPTPRGSPQSWVTNDDYPVAAMRAHATGTVGFRLDIGADGRVTRCTVTASSGAAALDTTTCTLLQRRARFVPARGANGPVAGTWSSRFIWMLPDTPAPFAPWARQTRFVVDARGTVRECNATRFGPVPAALSDLCGRVGPEVLAQLHGPEAGWATLTFVEVNRVEGMAMPAGYTAPAGGLLFNRTLNFTVDRQGNVHDCRVSGLTGSNVTALTNTYDCHPGLDYSINDATWGNAPRRPGSYTVSVIGDRARGSVPPAPPPPPAPRRP